MATTNPVFQVLVPSGNQALMASGSRVDALAIGQLGIFNYHTGLSIDGTVAADAKDVFIAVGIDPLGTGSIADINKSAGQVIQVRNAKSYTFRGYMGATQKIVDIGGFTAKCETDYAVKIEFRNQKSYRLNGYNQFTKSFTYTTGCCTQSDCTACPEGDCNELAVGLATEINKDTDGLVTAGYFAVRILATINGAPTADGDTVVTIGTTTYTVPVLDADTAAEAAAKIVAFVNAASGTPYKGTVSGAAMTFVANGSNGSTATFAVSGSGVTANAITAATKIAVTDTATFFTTYPGACLGVRITTVAEALNSYGAINLKYFNPRGTDIIVTLPDGFNCNGTVATVQELVFSEGAGYDIRQLEYVAGGWNGKPGVYRLSGSTGVERNGIVYFASLSGTYNIFDLTYDQMSVGGWLEYLNNLETIIAVPCADNTTLASLVAFLDAIFTQFGAMAGDVTANGDCSNAATGTLTPATDGIESLA